MTLLLYGYCCGRPDFNPNTDLAANTFDLALDRSGAKNIGFYLQRIGREWVLIIDVIWSIRSSLCTILYTRDMGH